MAKVTDNFHEFESQLMSFADEVLEQANLFKRAVALHTLRGILLKTPVDTGRARANWQVGVDRRPPGILDIEPGEDGATQLAMGDGSEAIAHSRLEEDIWLTNNLPYIEALEMGSSSQSPAGMVAVTLAELDAQFG